MAFFRRTFSRRLLPDRFQEITERVYVFDCCLSTKELAEEDYKTYMNTAVSNIQRYHPGASFMVFNFKEGENPSLLSDLLSHHDMTVIDYPRHYEGYPILPLEMIHYCLRSSDSWLSLEGQQNVILMHCERGGWPALASMLAGFLLYTKKQVGEAKTLEMVLKQAPKELLTPLSIMNPRPSQLRYLQYISSRSLTSDWPPSDAPLVVESLVLMNLPLFHGGKGCRPVVHVYGQDSSMRSARSPRLLCSSLMSEEGAHYYHKEECMKVKINLNCRVQGDVFVECIHLGNDLVSEEKIFKVMFHTAFVQSYNMLLDSSEVDVLWNAHVKIPNDFKAEVCFSNPKELQLSIAKEMASLESGHESESEFFEAEEFEVSLIVDNPPAHHSEDKQGDLAVKSFEKQDPAASFHDEEKYEHKTEAILSQELISDEGPKFDYEPIHDYEQVVTKESILEVSEGQVQGTSQEDSSEKASLQVVFEANKETVLIEDFAKDDSTSATLAAGPGLHKETKRFGVAEESQGNSEEATGSSKSQFGGSEYVSNALPSLEVRSEPDIIVVEGRQSEAVVESKSTSQTNNENKNSLTVEEKLEEISRAESKSKVEVEETSDQDFSKASPLEVKPEINMVVIEESENETSPKNTSETRISSRNAIFLQGSQDVKVQVQPKEAEAGLSKSLLGGSEDLSNAISSLEVRFETNGIAVEGSKSEAVVSKSVVVTEGSEGDSNTVFTKYTPQTNVDTASGEPGLELNSEIINSLTVEGKLDEFTLAESNFKFDQDSPKASHLELKSEPNMVVIEESETVISPKNTSEARVSSQDVIFLEGSQDITKAASFEANPAGKSFLVVQESKSEIEPKMAVEETETDLKLVSTINPPEIRISTENVIIHEASQDITKAPSRESNIEVVEERSQQDSSEVDSSEIESESCVMSKGFISNEGSEASSEAASSQTGSEFLVPQAASSEAKLEPSSSSKHIVVVTEDDSEHDVKVLVQPKAAEGGSKGVVLQRQKTIKNKKKMRLADAVAKVTMQKRVISMWVPRDKQSNRAAAPAYKWIPKESVSESQEEA